MAILCRDYNLLFIMVSATGCSSIGNVLRTRLGGEWVPAENSAGKNGRKLDHKHNTIDQLLRHRVLSKAEIDKLFKFATIRNPYDRYASEYERLSGTWMEGAMDSAKPKSWINRVAEPDREKLRARKLAEVAMARQAGFETWLRRKLIRSTRFDWKLIRRAQHLIHKTPLHGYSAFPMIDGVDDLIRYERLEEDLNRILRTAGVKDYIAVPHNNPTPGKKPYQEYYTPELQRLVERYIGDQLAKFGYSLEQPVAAGG